MRSNLLAALIIAAACGCSAPPGNGLLGGADEPAAGGPAASGATDGDAAAPGAPSPGVSGPGPGPTGTTMDSGTVGAPQDAGHDSAPPPPPPSVFNGADPFVAATAATTHHFGENCMNGCHNHGFTFAGTLTNGAGSGVAGAEVRIVDANGVGFFVNTDSLGNFHSSATFTAPAHIGARTATKTVNMTATITNGACNQCHTTGGTTTPIHVP